MTGLGKVCYVYVLSHITKLPKKGVFYTVCAFYSTQYSTFCCKNKIFLFNLRWAKECNSKVNMIRLDGIILDKLLFISMTLHP